MKFLCRVLIVTLLLPSPMALAGVQGSQTATTTVATPVFPSADVSLAPLRVAAAGSVLVLLSVEGDWCRVEFQDPQFGRRTGFVQSKDLRIERVPPDEAPIRLEPPTETNAPSVARNVREPARPTSETLGEETTAAGMLDGATAATSLRTGGKVGAGVVVGILTGVIGTGIGYFVIGPETMSPEAFQRYSNSGPNYQLGFKSGWDKKTQSKKRNAFLAGGLLGTAAWIAILVSARSQSPY